MRPLRLQMSNFGPYVGTQEVDFERLGAHGLFLIHGPTGAGKSSVLDAMCFALYGESTGDERKGKDVVSTHDPYAQTSVEFEFEHLGRRYRVKRSPAQTRPKRRGSGFRDVPEEAHLEDLTGSEVLADKVRAVSALVCELLRCDARQFRQTVVLPQGEFRKVVTDHGSRHQILSNVFRTGRFRRLTEALKEQRSTLEAEGKSIETRRKEILESLGVPDRPAADELLAGLRATEAELAEARRQREAGREAAREALTQARAVQEDFERHDDAVQRAAELEAQEPEVVEEERRLERAGRAAGLGDARRLLAKVEQDSAGAAQEVEAATAAAEAAQAAVEVATEAAERLEGSRPELEARAKRLLHLEHLEPKVVAAAESRQVLADGQAAHEEAKGALEAARQQAGGAAERAAAVAAALEELRQVTDQEAAAALALEEAKRVQADAAELRGCLAEAAEHDEAAKAVAAGEDPLVAVREAVARHAPGLLASDLVDGEPCPVCGATHHPTPADPEDVEALNRVFASFGEAAERMARLLHARDSALERARAIAEARGWPAGGPPELEVTARLGEARQQVERVAEAKERVAELSGEAADLKRRVEETAATVKAAEEEERRLGEAVLRLAAELEGALEGLPAEHREPGAFATALDAARREHEELKAGFESAAAALEDATQAHLRAVERLENARRAAADAAEVAEHERKGFAKRLAAAGFADLGDLDAATLPPEDLEDREAFVKRYREERQSLAGELKTLAKKIAGRERPDLAALQQAHDEAAEAASAAEAAWLEAKQRADSVAERLARYDALVSQDAAMEERRLAAKRLADLASGQVTGAVKMDLETFVLRSIFEQVLLEGNRHLHHMTGGRYQLALGEFRGKREEGLELDVIDSFSGGAARPAHTLSGGEGFLASLALALGLSEVAQRESGAAEHGALFIDEGFGSLDQDALEHVVDILRGLPEGHRMVGVISHVDELKKKVPVQLLVHKGADGSRLEVRVNA